jgi:flavin reductase (DIM6/NTAB) family NADH-FMN oxidoreductase RutF
VPRRCLGAAIESHSRTIGLIRAGGHFSLALFPKSERSLIRKFVKPAVLDESQTLLNGAAFFDTPVSGSPVPEGALGYLDCRLTNEIDLGSHHLVIGEVLDAAFVRDEGLLEDGVLEMSDTRMSYGG